MPIFCTCYCGARYEFPETAAGSQERCPRCGGIMILPSAGGSDEVIPLADEDAIDRPAASSYIREELQATRAARRSAPKGMAAPPPVIIERSGGFWRDALGCYIHFSSLESLLSFLAIWFLNVLAGAVASLAMMRGVLLLIFAVFVYGYVCAYYMSCVTHAAGGAPGLPPLTVESDWLEGMVIPMLQWWGSFLFVGAPAITAAVVLSFTAVSPAAAVTAVLLLAATGLLFWPMCILVVALGGLSMLPRFDLAVVAVSRSPGPYLLVCVLVLVSVAPLWAARAYLAGLAPVAIADMLTPGALALRGAVIGLQTYCMLACTRLVGVYYQHFKNDFPWSLG